MMRSRKRLAASCALATLSVVAPGSHADFVGGHAELISSDPDQRVYRIYAVFDDPDDVLLAVFGDDRAPLRIVTSTAIRNDGGAFAGTPLEDLPGAPFSGPLASWVTIGADTLQESDTALAPGVFDGDGSESVIVGRRVVEDRMAGGGWFDSNPETPVQPDSAGRILIAQIATDCDGDVLVDATLSWTEGPGGVLQSSRLSVRTSEEAVACIWDRDGVGGDGVINFDDLIAVIGHWGPCDACPSMRCRTSDFDGDLDVDFDDLLSVLHHWGPCDG